MNLTDDQLFCHKIISDKISTESGCDAMLRLMLVLDNRKGHAHVGILVFDAKSNSCLLLLHISFDPKTKNIVNKRCRTVAIDGTLMKNAGCRCHAGQ